MRKIPIEDAGEHGVTFSLKVSDETGEIRARVNARGIDSTITEVPPGCGGWQKSHSHLRVVERTTIISGAVVDVVRGPSGALNFRCFSAGESFKTSPGQGHNLLVTEGTLMVTIKEHDDPEKRDWIGDPDLDKELEGISAEEAFRRAMA